MAHSPHATRFHALDSLRAAMMLWGIVLHAGLPYSGSPRNPLWAVNDSAATPLAGALQAASNAFRMQAFFLIAGFFAALLERKYGLAGMLRNRLCRIALPFAAAWCLTFTVLRAAFVVAGSLGDPTTALAHAAFSGRLWADPYPIHLWFLEYVLIFYAALIPARLLAGHVSATWRARAHRAFRWTVATGPAPFVMLGLTLPTLLLSSQAGFDIPLAFRPRVTSLAAYGLFFAFGWMLHQQPGLLPSIAQRGPRWLLLGALVGAASPWLAASLVGPSGDSVQFAVPAQPSNPVSLPWEPPVPALNSVPDHPQPAVVSATSALPLPTVLSLLTSWLIVLGVLGVFLRLFDRPRPWVSYLTDASYWLYLSHFPCVAVVALILLPWEAPGEIKLCTNVALTLIALLLLYEAAVRRSIVGRMLIGRIGAPFPNIARGTPIARPELAEGRRIWPLSS